MPEQLPYKELEVVDHGGEAVATFTREKREDSLIKVEIRGGVSVRMEPGTLNVIAQVMANDTLRLS